MAKSIDIDISSVWEDVKNLKPESQEFFNKFLLPSCVNMFVDDLETNIKYIIRASKLIEESLNDLPNGKSRRISLTFNEHHSPEFKKILIAMFLEKGIIVEFFCYEDQGDSINACEIRRIPINSTPVSKTNYKIN